MKDQTLDAFDYWTTRLEETFEMMTDLRTRLASKKHLTISDRNILSEDLTCLDTQLTYLRFEITKAKNQKTRLQKLFRK